MCPHHMCSPNSKWQPCVKAGGGGGVEGGFRIQRGKEYATLYHDTFGKHVASVVKFSQMLVLSMGFRFALVAAD